MLLGLDVEGRRRDHSPILDRQRRARLEGHPRHAILAVETKCNVVADHLLRLFVQRSAAALGRRRDVFLLHVLLDPVAGIPPSGGSGDGGQRVAFAATDGTAQETAGQPTDYGPGNAVPVLHGRLLMHLNVFAFLTRSHYRLEDLLRRDDFGKLRLRHRLLARDGAGAEHHHGDATDCNSLDH